MDNNYAYRELFFKETDMYLDTLNNDILELEKNSDDREVIDAIFRSAHTLKGMAQTMGYNQMAELTHQLESLFQLIKNGAIRADHDNITLIFKCLDALSEMRDNLREMDNEGLDVIPLVTSLKEVTSSAERKEPQAAEAFSLSLIPILNSCNADHLKLIEEARELGCQSYMIAVRLEAGTFMKGARSFLILEKLKKSGQIILTEPSEREMESNEFSGLFNILYVSKLSGKEIERLLLTESDIESLAIKEVSLSIKAPAKQQIPVDVDHLDYFMNQVNELVIHGSRLESLTTEYEQLEIIEPLRSMKKIARALQGGVLQLRMQPFSVVLQPLPRMVRDLAGQLNKELKLVTAGEEIELDYTVTGKLGELLMHLIRNACDHGIEDPDTREELRKSRQGLITVAARQTDQHVIISVSDDGKGIDPRVIAENAENKGIDIAGLTDDEIIQLILRPGFSTKKIVTGVSGRGVGMDVVKEKIESLDGDIQVESTVGKGSTFLLSLPLTLSAIQSVIVEAGSKFFGIPQSFIKKEAEYSAEQVEIINQREVYNYEDTLIPLIYLSEALGLKKDLKAESHVLIIKIQNEYYALVIENLHGTKDIVIKDLDSESKQMKEYLGTTILENGDVILVLDIASVLNS